MATRTPDETVDYPEMGERVTGGDTAGRVPPDGYQQAEGEDRSDRRDVTPFDRGERFARFVTLLAGAGQIDAPQDRPGGHPEDDDPDRKGRRRQPRRHGPDLGDDEQQDEADGSGKAKLDEPPSHMVAPQESIGDGHRAHPDGERGREAQRRGGRGDEPGMERGRRDDSRMRATAG
jgi:hypothetical protein